MEKTLRRTNIKRFSKSNRMTTGKDSLGANREGIIGVRGAVFIRIAVIGRRTMSTVKNFEDGHGKGFLGYGKSIYVFRPRVRIWERRKMKGY